MGRRLPGAARRTSASEFGVLPTQPRIQIPRQRLEAELERATLHPLTVVVAPAGAGKTSGLARWAATLQPSVRWLVARKGDRPEILAQALLAAAGADGKADVDWSAEDLVRGVTESLRSVTAAPEPLVIDDAQNLTPASWALLDEVVTAAPDHLRVVLATRRDTPLPTVALELGDALTVLRSDVLKFDDHEAGQLVVAHAPDATDEDVHAIQARADGWAAALVLGARSLAAAPDRPAARTALAHTEQPVLDYLLGEVFATMPAASRHVLQCTTDEPVVTGEVAVLLSGDPQAPEHLAALAAEGMLVTAYGAGSVEAWSYHPLLRELLRRQLAGPDRALGLAAHKRAAHHHALHGPLDEAVRHAMLAGEHDLLASLLVERGVTLMTTGHEGLVAEALRALPDGTTEERPALLGVTALLLRSTGDREQAVRVATLASRAARRTRDDVLTRGGKGRTPTIAEAALLADVAILNAWLARLGWHDLGDAVAGGREVAARTAAAEQAGASGELDPARLSWLLYELSVVETWAGDFEPATQHSDEALVAAQAVDNHRLAAGALADRAVLQLLDGQFQTAAATARDCLAEARAAGRSDDGFLGRAHVALGWAAFYDLRLEEAAAELAEAQRIDARRFDPLVSALGHVLAARLLAETGDVAGARRLLSAAPPHPQPSPAFLEGIYAVVRAYWALVDGDVGETAAQLPAMRRLGWQVSTAAFAAVLADLGGHPEEALVRLDEALAVPASGEQLVCAAFAAAYLARIELAEGRLDAAAESLREALTRAAPQKLLHPLLAGASPGGAYDDLLRQLARGPDPHPFAAYVVEGLGRYRRPYPDLSARADAVAASAGKRRAAGTSPRRPAGHPAGAPLPPQTLTGREAEVLRELALGGSYQDVAQVLYVTENTVKTHVSAVYRKLGVERRADALRRAREIGLI